MPSYRFQWQMQHALMISTSHKEVLHCLRTSCFPNSLYLAPRPWAAVSESRSTISGIPLMGNRCIGLWMAHRTWPSTPMRPQLPRRCKLLQYLAVGSTLSRTWAYWSNAWRVCCYSWITSIDTGKPRNAASNWSSLRQCFIRFLSHIPGFGALSRYLRPWKGFLFSLIPSP